MIFIEEFGSSREFGILARLTVKAVYSIRQPPLTELSLNSHQ